MKKLYIRVEIPTREGRRVHRYAWINAYVCSEVVGVYEELAQVTYVNNRRRRRGR